MKKIKLVSSILVVALSMGMFVACGQEDKGTVKDENVHVTFIPKVTGNMFFESANLGAQDIGKKEGFTVKYDGSPEASVSNQVQIINSSVTQGTDAISISALSQDGLNQALQNAKNKGVEVVTWDSDVDPKYRSVYISQGTPKQLGKMLVDMAVEDMNEEQKKEAKIAFFYSSPTVTDQNSWVKFANEYIKAEYPGWEVVTTQYGDQDAQKSLQVGESILQTYSDIDAVLCPDSTALPAMAQALKNLKRKDVIVTGFASPNSMKEFVKDGTINRFGLWDCKVQGAIGAYAAAHLAQGNQLKVGDTLNVPNIGELKVESNKIQGYDYEAEDSGVILLPERVVFTKDNVDNYDF
ncbi:MAG: autoinducer 2 ABC transporter substrate-binding protein LsrB [Sarcina sp.]